MMPPLQETLDRLHKLSSQIDNCTQALEKNTQEIASLVTRGEEIEEQCTSLVSECEEQGEWFGEVVDTNKEFIGATTDAILDRANGCLEFVSDLIETQWVSLQEDWVEVRDETMEWAEQQGEKGVSLFGESETAIQDLVIGHQERTASLGEETIDEVKKAFNELTQYLKDRVIQTFQDESKKTGEAAIERVKQEVIDSVIEGQLQTQITSLLSPYLPQLMAAKAVAPAIARALEIARAGF